MGDVGRLLRRYVRGFCGQLGSTVRKDVYCLSGDHRCLDRKTFPGPSSAHMINSEELRKLVVEGRIPLETNLSARETWWRRTKLKATHIVFEIVEPQQGALKLKLSFFKPKEVRNDKLIGSKFEVSVPVEQLGNLLEPSEPSAGIVPLYRDANGHPLPGLARMM